MMILRLLAILWFLACTVITMVVGRRLMKNAQSNKQFYAGYALTMCSLLMIGFGLVLA